MENSYLYDIISRYDIYNGGKSMKEYNTSNIRNVAILGHLGCGKTSFGEALLYAAKAIDKKGEVERKNTVGDYTVEEQARQTTLISSLIGVGSTRIVSSSTSSSKISGSITISESSSLIFGSNIFTNLSNVISKTGLIDVTYL